MYINSEQLARIRDEAKAAFGKYGPYTSTHEALGVIREEYRELEDAIRANASASIQTEAIQLAATALRLAEQCEEVLGGGGLMFGDRSGFKR